MAGIFGFFDYTRPGKGVDKGGPEKKRFFVFWDLYFRKFWKLIQLNLIFLLFSLPIITIGPAYVAMCRVMKDMVNERGVFLFSDFFDAFKSNFKQSIGFWLIDLAVAFLLSVSIPFYYEQAATDNILMWVMFGVSGCIAIMWVLVNCYMFCMIPILDMKLFPMMRNAFLLSIVGLKSNVVTLLGLAILFVGSLLLFWWGAVQMLIAMLVFAVLLFSTSAFLVMFNCYPIINKHIIAPYYERTGEQRPDEFYFEEEEFDDIIFEDIGTKEQQPAKTKAVGGAKGKTIK